MFIEGKRKRKGIANRIVKIYRYKVPSRNRTYNIIYKSTTRKKQQKLGYLPVTSVLEGHDLTSSNMSNLSNLSRDNLGPNGASSASFNGSLVPKVVRLDEDVGHVGHDSVGPRRKKTNMNKTDKNYEEEEDEHPLIANFCQRLQDASSAGGGERKMKFLAVNNDENDEDEDDECSDEYTDSGGGSWPRFGRKGHKQGKGQEEAPSKEDLEQMIAELEEENRKLCDEYEQLKKDRQKRLAKDENEDENDVVVLEEEARQLKQHSNRMETRMRILEEHNGQLENQLRRLRQLLAQAPKADDLGHDDSTDLGHNDRNDLGHDDRVYPAENNDNFGTLTSRSVVASQLHVESPAAFAGVGSFGRRRRARDPPTSREVFGQRGQHNQHGQLDQHDQRGQHGQPFSAASVHDDTDSLDLSEHETQRVDD
jgi:hypothetical protein